MVFESWFFSVFAFARLFVLGRGMETTSVNGSHDQPVWWVEPVSL